MLLQNSLPWRAWLGYLQVSSPSQWWSHHATVTIAGFVSVCRCAWLQRMCLTPFFYKETKGSGVSRNKNLNIFCIASLRWRSGTLTVKLWVKISWTVSVHIGKKSKGTNLKKPPKDQFHILGNTLIFVLSDSEMRRFISNSCPCV